jgi:hypothetical protein
MLLVDVNVHFVFGIEDSSAFSAHVLSGSGCGGASSLNYLTHPLTPTGYYKNGKWLNLLCAGKQLHTILARVLFLPL